MFQSSGPAQASEGLLMDCEETKVYNSAKELNKNYMTLKDIFCSN